MERPETAVQNDLFLVSEKGAPTIFSTGFGVDQIASLDQRYIEQASPDLLGIEIWLVERLAPRAQERGYLDRDEFLVACRWLSRETADACSGNSEEDIREATARALSEADDAKRLAPLVLLEGMGLQTAGVVLHFVHPAGFPVLEGRRLWTLGILQPLVFKLKLWQEYTNQCREIAADAGVSMRTLDRALLQYAKENRII